MQSRIRIISQNNQTNDETISYNEQNDFSVVCLGKASQEQMQGEKYIEPENDFRQFTDYQNSSKSWKDDKFQQQQILNQPQAQDGSMQFKQIQVDNQSNQNSGAILMETSYNQYSDKLPDYISHYDCQISNTQSQQLDQMNPQYGDYGAVENVLVQNYTFDEETNQLQELDIFQRYYNNEKCSYLLPITQIQAIQLEEDGVKYYSIQMIDYSQNNLWDSDEDIIENNSQEIINQENVKIKKKKTKRGNRKNKNKKKNEAQQEHQKQNEQESEEEQVDPESTNQFDNGNIEQLDDAVSEEFRINITSFLEQIEKSKISLTQTMYGNKDKSIKIIEINNYQNQIQRLCNQFSYLKYSQIALSLLLIVDFQNCEKFLQSVKPKEEKLIIREINQLIEEEQKARESQDKAELTKTNIKIEEFKKVNKIQNVEGQSLYQTAIKIIDIQNLKFDIKKCDQQTKQQKKADFEQNRDRVIAIYDQKAKVIKQYQTCHINELQCNQQLQQITVEKRKLEKIGKQLFLDLMVIENGFCRIDFHKFFSAEIENLLDGVFEKIESYKLYNKQQKLKLQIIVGKGLHSKNQQPIIGPITQQYLQQYLGQQIEIIEGKIDVII
ncbi:unnamed protein product (macronuclear) [Paramecium tetraurelia]|uniref:Smr domain-containing protein n=1 Tax=Paramecium tetraurelia TaxID=5888 RepID=A0DV15_PARTE|nr:uncharacterized protein GSPATT00020544001 [Paramecium tetraurelia]CAK86882.1 unnamed protein product [Paramecium tetraurelia]|eukprot:XP_001454279.1 hypothetical protein (macronuclear) [Paramecium tetraurelia strain d4-2]